MKKSLLPPLWLILLIVGLPQLSETVYTPALPDIAHALSVSGSLVEYTLTIYLFGFAIATLFWGSLSDKWGRKPCVLMGFALYLLGSFGCYFSESIHCLMMARFVQGFGGSVGSVLGQSICRDAFHGAALGRVYASLTGALAIFPAVGPIIGGGIDQAFGWASIFLFLIVFGAVVIGCIVYALPETHSLAQRQSVSLKQTFIKMAYDKKVIGLGLLTALINGIVFSYYAEGPFYLIELLGLTPSEYGLTFLGRAFSSLCGGMTARKLHDGHSPQAILTYGLFTTLVGGAPIALGFPRSFFSFLSDFTHRLPNRWNHFIDDDHNGRLSFDRF